MVGRRREECFKSAFRTSDPLQISRSQRGKRPEPGLLRDQRLFDRRPNPDLSDYRRQLYTQERSGCDVGTRYPWFQVTEKSGRTSCSAAGRGIAERARIRYQSTVRRCSKPAASRDVKV